MNSKKRKRHGGNGGIGWPVIGVLKEKKASKGIKLEQTPAR